MAPASGTWSAWLQEQSPSGNGAFVLYEDYVANPPCNGTDEPTAVECRTAKQHTAWFNTGLEMDCTMARGGLRCVNRYGSAAHRQRCPKMEARFLCSPEAVAPPPSPPPSPLPPLPPPPPGPLPPQPTTPPFPKQNSRTDDAPPPAATGSGKYIAAIICVSIVAAAVGAAVAWKMQRRRVEQLERLVEVFDEDAHALLTEVPNGAEGSL